MIGFVLYLMSQTDAKSCVKRTENELGSGLNISSLFHPGSNTSATHNLRKTDRVRAGILNRFGTALLLTL